jgi:hypothetical protein
MENLDLKNLKYQPHIIKKQEHNTLFLIDTHTGALFSQSRSGIFTFQNAEGRKWLYTDNPINIETDIPHFVTITDSGATCIEGMFAVFENKEAILQKAFNYFSKFIIEETDKQKWNTFLN